MRERYRAGTVVREIMMIAAGLIFLFPLYVLLTISLKTPAETTDDTLGLPSSLNVENYRQAWDSASLGSAMINSMVVTGLSLVLLVLCGSAAAYVLSRRLSRLSTGLYVLFLLGLMIPIQLGMVPLYEFMKSAFLLQTYTSVILFSVGVHLPMTVFLYAGFMRAIPRDFEEAAAIDGSSWRRTYFQIMLPMVKPVTATVIILNVNAIWNDFLVPMLYLAGSAQQTLPVAVFAFRGEFSSDWAVLFAGMIIAIVPVLVAFVFLQKYIIRGFAGGLKG